MQLDRARCRKEASKASTLCRACSGCRESEQMCGPRPEATAHMLNAHVFHSTLVGAGMLISHTGAAIDACCF
jgi:hypothetical protein